ncbi:MAG: glycosyltransferase [Elusimicrobiota bacterium]
MKKALVQDWLTGMRGGEKVLEQLCEIYPDVPLYTMIHNKGSVSDTIEDREIVKSWLQHIPFGRRFYRYFLPFMPLLVKSLNLKKYDLVISTSHCVAKNVKSSKGGLHICYCHSPMRYIWDMFDHYFTPAKSMPVYLAMKLVRPYLQFVDRWTSKNVDYFIANSQTTADRISRYYNRESRIIYPPVDTHYYTPGQGGRENFYLVVSSMVPYKKVDIAVKAFNRSGKKLKVIGSGPELNYLKKIAKGNIEFFEWCEKETLRKNYRRCRALIFPGKEDFGIVPVEAMACGSPVLAYNEGGATESVVKGKTGLFFNRQSSENLNRVIRKFEKINFETETVRKRAEEFSQKRFKKEITEFIEEKI